jgi:hypothetical protein
MGFGALLPYGRSNLYALPGLPLATRHRLSREHWTELGERSKNESLRQLARRYGLSHEAVRGALKAATSPCSSRMRQPYMHVIIPMHVNR